MTKTAYLNILSLFGFRSTPIILDAPAILALSVAYSCKYAGQSDANPQEKLTIAESKANMQQLLGPKNNDC